jgi:hypothetical protein
MYIKIYPPPVTGHARRKQYLALCKHFEHGIASQHFSGTWARQGRLFCLLGGNHVFAMVYVIPCIGCWTCYLAQESLYIHGAHTAHPMQPSQGTHSLQMRRSMPLTHPTPSTQMWQTVDGGGVGTCAAGDRLDSVQSVALAGADQVQRCGQGQPQYGEAGTSRANRLAHLSKREGCWHRAYIFPCRVTECSRANCFTDRAARVSSGARMWQANTRRRLAGPHCPAAG